MKDIKELATLTAAEMDDIYLRNVPAIILEQYATRLIAAYAEGQEPVSLYPCGFKELKSLVIKHGAYLARGMNEDEPVTESIRSSAMVLVGYAKDMSDLLAKQPLFTAPPEPAPRLPEGCMWAVTKGGHSICQPPKSFCQKGAAPSSEEVGQLHPDMARSAAKSALGYAGSFNDKGIDWHNDKPWQHRMELAQALDWITELGAMVLNLADRVTPAAPSSEEVREMVERLYGDIDGGPSSWLKQEAADLIERLAAERDGWIESARECVDRLAARVPDGCVVVPIADLKNAAGSYEEGDGQSCVQILNRLIAAVEVKP